MLASPKPLRLRLQLVPRACRCPQPGSARPRPARSRSGARRAPAESPSRRPGDRRAARASPAARRTRGAAPARSPDRAQFARVDPVRDHRDPALVDVEHVGDVAAHVVGADDQRVRAVRHPPLDRMDVRLRRVLHPALVTPVLGGVDRRHVRHAQAVGKRRRRRARRASRGRAPGRSACSSASASPAASMSSFICSTHATKRSRSRGQPGSRTRCTLTPASCCTRRQRPALLAEAARQHVDRNALANERLGELAHVARQAALDHGRVLPGEEQHSTGHCQTLYPPPGRRAPARPPGNRPGAHAAPSKRDQPELIQSLQCPRRRHLVLGHGAAPSSASRCKAGAMTAASASTSAWSSDVDQARASVVAQQLQDDRSFQARTVGSCDPSDSPCMEAILPLAGPAARRRTGPLTFPLGATIHAAWNGSARCAASGGQRSVGQHVGLAACAGWSTG